jgi:PAS domain S-box-containing protein
MKLEEDRYWLSHQIVMEAHDAIILADRKGIMRLWNKGAEMVFGFSPAEALGQTLHIIIPENLWPRHDQGCDKVMESGHSNYSTELLAVPALK